MARLQSIKQKYHVQIHLTVPRRPIRRPARPVQKGTPPANVIGVADDSALELSSSAAAPIGAPPGISTSGDDPTIGTLTNGSGEPVNGEANHSGAADVEHPVDDEATASSSLAPARDASAQPPEANHSSTSCVPSSEGASNPGAVEEATAADAAPAAVPEKPDGAEEPSPAQMRDPEQDVVRIVGQPDCVHKAEEELRALLPVVVRVPVPAEFQSQIFAGRGGPQFWRQLEHSHDIVVHPVVISGAPPEGSALHAAITDDSDVSQFAILRGVREDIDAATKEIEARLAECVQQKEDMVCSTHCFTVLVLSDLSFPITVVRTVFIITYMYIPISNGIDCAQLHDDHSSEARIRADSHWQERLEGSRTARQVQSEDLVPAAPTSSAAAAASTARCRRCERQTSGKRVAPAGRHRRKD